MRALLLIMVVSFLSCTPSAYKVSPDDKEFFDTLVQESDDYEKHKEAFVVAAFGVLHGGPCAPNEIKEQGGWKRYSRMYGPEDDAEDPTAGVQMYRMECGSEDKRKEVILVPEHRDGGILIKPRPDVETVGLNKLRRSFE